MRAFWSKLRGDYSCLSFASISYLGVHRSDDLVVIQITLCEGGTLEQKKALHKAIADGLNALPGIRREDVFINLVEVRNREPVVRQWPRAIRDVSGHGRPRT